jgi:hypothetical protein
MPFPWEGTVRWRLLREIVGTLTITCRGERARETVAAVRQLIYAREQEVDLATQLQRLQLPADAEAVEWNSSSSRQPLDSDDSDQVSNSSIIASR